MSHYDVQILIDTGTERQGYTAEAASFDDAIESIQSFREGTGDEIIAFEVRQQPDEDDTCPVCHNGFPPEYDLEDPHAPVYLNQRLYHRSCAPE